MFHPVVGIQSLVEFSFLKITEYAAKNNKKALWNNKNSRRLPGGFKTINFEQKAVSCLGAFFRDYRFTMEMSDHLENERFSAAR